ncbi:MAG TPA: hypothetical protein VGN97_09915 [Mesorhizobium sp.]|jgi:RNA-splicing ligase RtcB|nr:hypothetical protein [Mesorhizobium sp.]
MELGSRALAGDNAHAAQELAEKLKSFIRRRAEELLRLPADERDVRLSDVHAAAMYLATEHGRAEAEAMAWAMKIVLITRAMMQALEEQTSPAWLASRLRAVMERDRAEVGQSIRWTQESLGEG